MRIKGHCDHDLSAYELMSFIDRNPGVLDTAYIVNVLMSVSHLWRVVGILRCFIGLQSAVTLYP
jgi:hypothetical protein